jgi:dethiobiotin synthetase
MCGMKPICCGDRRDAEALLAADSDCVAIDDVNPVWLKHRPLLSWALFMEKVTIDIEQILSAFHTLQQRVEYVVVEGTGGWLVPIRANYFGSDLAAAMKVPVLMVAQNRLGCLNHVIPYRAKHCRTAASVRGSGIEQHEWRMTWRD